MCFLLGFLRVNPVCQSYNQSGDEETHYNTNHQSGLVAVFRLICRERQNRNIRGVSVMFLYAAPVWTEKKILWCALNALMNGHIRTVHDYDSLIWMLMGAVPTLISSMGLWTMLASCQDAGSSIPPTASQLYLFKRSALSKHCFFCSTVQGDTKDKFLIKSRLLVSNIRFPHRLSSTHFLLFLYKKEDRANLPCLSILTSSITEIRYEITLTSNRNEGGGKKTKQKSKLEKLLLYIYSTLHARGSKREQIKSSIPTYTHWARGGGREKNDVEMPSQTHRNEEARENKWWYKHTWIPSDKSVD